MAQLCNTNTILIKLTAICNRVKIKEFVIKKLYIYLVRNVLFNFSSLQLSFFVVYFTVFKVLCCIVELNITMQIRTIVKVIIL